jgi:hypothetical protein
MNSTVFSYFINCQPHHWYRKEVIYYLPNNQKEVQIFESAYAPVEPLPPSYHSQPPIASEQHFRDSFGSSNSQLSTLKAPQSLSGRHLPAPLPSQQNYSYNPYELNHNSFLKNRIQSLSRLDQHFPSNVSDDSKSGPTVALPSTKSLLDAKPNNSRSPPKVCFKYMPSSPHGQTAPLQPQPLKFQPQPQHVLHLTFSPK